MTVLSSFSSKHHETVTLHCSYFFSENMCTLIRSASDHKVGIQCCWCGPSQKDKKKFVISAKSAAHTAFYSAVARLGTGTQFNCSETFFQLCICLIKIWFKRHWRWVQLLHLPFKTCIPKLVSILPFFILLIPLVFFPQFNTLEILIFCLLSTFTFSFSENILLSRFLKHEL